jgi:hypothetical protein
MFVEVTIQAERKNMFSFYRKDDPFTLTIQKRKVKKYFPLKYIQ